MNHFSALTLLTARQQGQINSENLSQVVSTGSLAVKRNKTKEKPANLGLSGKQPLKYRKKYKN